MWANFHTAKATRCVWSTGCGATLGRRDFTAVAAVDGPHLAGFAYGYTDTVCAGLDPASTAVHEAFEVIELAVATFYRSRGIGRARPDGAPARAGISPAHAGFATASLTRIRLAARWQPPLPRMRLRGSSHGHRGLAWATGHGAWPAAATGLLAVAGAGYGAGFGARVQRTVGAVPAAHAPSGVQRALSTVIQLSIAVGIAFNGTIYRTAPLIGTLSAFSVTALALSIVQIAVGAAPAPALWCNTVSKV